MQRTGLNQALFRKARVYDPVLRLLHWVNALSITVLLASGLAALCLEHGQPRAWLHQWHGLFGATLITGLAARITWGLTGPQHARLMDLWQPASWRAMLESRRLFSAPERFGHHPAASLAYLIAYTLAGVLAATGLMLLAIEQGVGPFGAWLAWDAALRATPDLIHVAAAWAILGFVCLHLAALILHPLLHRVPVAQAMLTGIQYLPVKDDQ